MQESCLTSTVGTHTYDNIISFGQFPARLDAKQTAQVLGVEEHDIPILILHRLLRPLGKPKQNARKYFAKVHIFALGHDAGWLAKATQALYDHWQAKNANRTKDVSVMAIAA